MQNHSVLVWGQDTVHQYNIGLFVVQTAGAGDPSGTSVSLPSIDSHRIPLHQFDLIGRSVSEDPGRHV